MSVHYEQAGDGRPTILFVHGGFCSLHDWRHQVERLSGTWRTVTLDLPGHGRSTVGDPGSLSPETCAHAVNRVRAELGVGSCVLVGHSFGTRVVLEAACREPDNVTGIVLVDTSRVGAPGHEVDDGPISAALDELGATPFIRRYFTDMMIGEHSSTIMSEVAGNRLKDVDADMIRAIMRSTVRWDSYRMDDAFAELSSLDVLAIQSTTNHMGQPRRTIESNSPVPWLDLLAERIERLTTTRIPRAGHFCMLEKPGPVSEAIARFVDSLVAGRS